MNHPDATGMRDVAVYAPFRVALTGIWRLIMGFSLGAPAAVLVYIGPKGDPGTTRSAGDTPAWWIFIVGVVLLFTCIQFIAGGVGRLLAAFARDCYFRAGPDGIALRMPKFGWFGRFRFVAYRIGWSEIKQLVHVIHRHYGYAVASELHIELRNGKTIGVERFLFSANVKTLRQDLLTIGTSVGR